MTTKSLRFSIPFGMICISKLKLIYISNIMYEQNTFISTSAILFTCSLQTGLRNVFKKKHDDKLRSFSLIADVVSIKAAFVSTLKIFRKVCGSSVLVVHLRTHKRKCSTNTIRNSHFPLLSFSVFFYPQSVFLRFRKPPIIVRVCRTELNLI